MEECSRNKKASSRLYPSARGSGFSSKDASSSRDSKVPVCSRVGCSSRVSLSCRAPTEVSNKTKSMKQPFRVSTNVKETIGSSSKPPPSAVGPGRLCSYHGRKLPSQTRSELESNNGLRKESHLSEPVLTAKNSRFRLSTPPNVHSRGESTSQEASSSSLTTLSTSDKTSSGKYERSGHVTTGSSSLSTSLTFRNRSYIARNDASTNRSEIKNVKCHSMSNGAQSSCSSSSSESSYGRGRQASRKKNSEAESSSSAKEKKVHGATVDDRKINLPSGGISISDPSRARNSPASGRDTSSSHRGFVSSSVSVQRGTVRSMFNAQENRNRSPHSDSTISGPLSSTQPDTLRSENGSISRYRLRSQSSSSRTNVSSQPGSSSEIMHNNSRSSTSSDVAFGRSSTTRENLRTYALDGIAEMLLALDRIEHDEHHTYEQQLFFLERNLFLGGISFHDRHRDMRLDIDNMTYEELLALEERMGTVSTALPEEALEKCLKKSIFHSSSPTGAEESYEKAEVVDEIKCSICQEEYTEGDELGKLGCEHRYHVECVTHWLKLKNWCPICKTSAQSSSS